MLRVCLVLSVTLLFCVLLVAGSRFPLTRITPTTRILTGSPCPANWRQRGFSCYLANATSTLSWAGASAFCQEHGGSLVSINNRTKLLDVVDVLRGDIQLEWWINIRKTSGNVLAERGSGFDNFGEEKIDRNADQEHQCVLLSTDDGFWYWRPCDRQLTYICQKPAQRVDIELVTPDRRRPEPAWFAAHAARLQAALAARQQNASDTDDKGTFNPTKVTMTPIPPPTTTPVTEPPSTTSALPPGAPSAPSTASPCSGNGWFLVAHMCHHLFLEVKTWNDARTFCRQQGGTLSHFRTLDEQDSFTQRYSYNTGLVWIGYRRLSDHPSVSSPMWLPPIRDSPWAPGQPVNGQNCGALALHTGLRHSDDCATQRAFACGRTPGAVPMPTTPSQPATSTATPTTTAAVPECGEGSWWRSGNSCLLLVANDSVSWHAAQQHCRARAAMLAKIDAFSQISSVLSKLSGVAQVWIGLSKWRVAGGQFRWSDGSAVTQTFWAGGHNDTAEASSCVRMDGDHGYWSTANCNLPQPYLCEKPVSGGVQWPPPARPPLRSTCLQPWQPYGADRCIRLFPRLASYSTARQQCLLLGPDVDLVTVPSPVYQAFLTSAVRESQYNVWLGLVKVKQRRPYHTWVDEAPVNFTDWAPGQPSNLCPTCPGTCGVADGGRSATPGVWSDVDCGNLFSYVCQRPATPNNTIETGLNMCDAPYDQYTAAGDACYKINHEEMTWSEAADTCQREGSSLAYVGNAFDNAELVKLLYRDGRAQYWIGLSDTLRYGTMEWTAPWPASPTYLNWDEMHIRAPVRSTCATLQPNSGLWWHQSCSPQRPFVCMRAPDRTAAALSDQGCPQDGEWVGSESRCYRLYSGTGVGKSWNAAKDACESSGYRLAAVWNIQDFLAVRETLRLLINSTTAWIGLHYTDNSYRWTNGSEGSFTGWHKLFSRQSSSWMHDPSCVEADALVGGHWRASDCSRVQPYICVTQKSLDAPVAGAVISSSSSGWTTFGVILLMAVLIVSVLGAGLWYARRRHAPWLPAWVAGAPATHHSVDNPAYDHHNNALASNRLDGGSLENGDLDRHVSHRWGSQEQLVADEDL